MIPLLERWNRYQQYGNVNEEMLDTWYEFADPLARELLDEASPLKHDRLPLQIRLVPADKGIYGRFMGGWPETTGNDYRLYVTDDWSFYLALLRNAVDPIVSEDMEPLFVDHSRIKVGVTNDVLQPFAPLPDPYSMVRHHSLMLMIGTLWLEEKSRSLWFKLYQACGDWLKKDYQSASDVCLMLETIETNGIQAFRDNAQLTLSNKGIQSLEENDAVMDRLNRYIQATCFGIAVLWDDYQKSDDKNNWFHSQLHEKLPDPDYLKNEIRSYCRS